MEGSVELTCSSEVDSGRGQGVSASYKEAAPDAGLERGWELRELTLTLFYRRLILQDSWKMPLLPPRVGCMVVLEKGPYSSWRYYTSRGACTEDE